VTNTPTTDTLGLRGADAAMLRIIDSVVFIIVALDFSGHTR